MFALHLPAPLLRKIKRRACEDLVDKLVGLSLCPEFQANLLRIITLIHVALAEARGAKRATRKDLAELLNGFGDHDARRYEDPPEDVFVSSVATPQGQYRIFNGIYPASDYGLQRLLSAVLAQNFAQHEQVSQRCQALLRLSETVAERCGLIANTFAESTQWRSDWPFGLQQVLQRGRATRFSGHDLRRLGIDSAALEPFCVPTLDGLLDAPFGATALCRQPLIRQDDGIHVPVPSLVSPALRLHLAHAIAERVVPWKTTIDIHINQFSRWIGVDLAMRKTKPLQVVLSEVFEDTMSSSSAWSDAAIASRAMSSQKAFSGEVSADQAAPAFPCSFSWIAAATAAVRASLGPQSRTVERPALRTAAASFS